MTKNVIIKNLKQCWESFHLKIVYEQGAFVVGKSIESSHETVKYLKLSQHDERVDLLRILQICKLFALQQIIQMQIKSGVITNL